MIYSLTVTNSIGESLTFELSNPWASGYAIKNIDGLGTPDMNVNSTPYGIGDGSVLGSIKAEYRLITIILYPLALPTVETSRQRLYRYFQMKKKILLTFNTENRLVHINGYVQNISPNIFDNPESISIEIKCLNPYFYKMNDDQTKFYGIEPTFEFIFSCEFVPVEAEEDPDANLFSDIFDISDYDGTVYLKYSMFTQDFDHERAQTITIDEILEELADSFGAMFFDYVYKFDREKKQFLYSEDNENWEPIKIQKEDETPIELKPPRLEENIIEPIEFSQFTIDNRMTIEYEGEVDAGIKITIECQTPPGDIIIYNVETLQYIQIFAERIEAASGAPLGPKDIIEINTESGEKYVRLLRNGIYYNVLGAMNRGMTWFVLRQGPNTFTYTTTDEHAAISMTFSYRDTYAAI